MIIHTDTNVWYDLEINDQQFDELVKLGVRPTYHNINELYLSEKMVSKPKLWQKAVKNIMRFSDYITFTDPIEEMFQKELILIREDKMKGLNILMNLEEVKLLNNENLRNELNKANEGKLLVTAAANEILPMIQAQFPDKQDKKMRQESQERGIESLYNFINKINIATRQVNPIPKEQFMEKELFVRTFNQFGISREIIEGSTVKANDWVDNFNMLYVKKGDKYWTGERRINNRIRELGLQEYIFDGDSYLNRDY
jgi:hypothetical protein